MLFWRGQYKQFIKKDTVIVHTKKSANLYSADPTQNATVKGAEMDRPPCTSNVNGKGEC